MCTVVCRNTPLLPTLCIFHMYSPTLIRSPPPTPDSTCEVTIKRTLSTFYISLAPFFPLVHFAGRISQDREREKKRKFYISNSYKISRFWRRERGRRGKCLEKELPHSPKRASSCETVLIGGMQGRVTAALRVDQSAEKYSRSEEHHWEYIASRPVFFSHFRQSTNVHGLLLSSRTYRW